MKTFKYLTITLFILVVSLSVSCTFVFAQDESSQGNIVLEKKEAVLDPGDQETLYVTTESSDVASWESSDPDVISIVDSNSRTATIRAIGVGDTTIVAKDAGGSEAVCTIRVLPEEITLSEEQLTIKLGKEKTIYSWDSSGGCNINNVNDRMKETTNEE